MAPADGDAAGATTIGTAAASSRALFARYLAPQWRSVSALLVLLVTTVAVQITQPRLIASFIDAASAGRPFDTLVGLAVAFIALAVVGQVAGVADVFLAQHVALTATNRLRADLTLHCLRLDLGFHSAHRPGELIQRVEGDVSALDNFLSRFLVAIAGNLLLLGGVVAMVTAVDWRLGVELATVCVAVPAIGWRYRTVGKQYWQPFLDAQADRAGMLEETLSATEDVRSSGAVAWALRRSAEHDRTVLRRQQSAAFLGNLVGQLGGGAFGLGGVVVLATAVWLQQRGSASVGDVFVAFAYTQLLAEPVQVLSRQLQDFQTASAAIVRTNELLEVQPSLTDGTAAPLPPGPLHVELDGVTFAYPAAHSAAAPDGDGEPVLPGADAVHRARRDDSHEPKEATSGDDGDGRDDGAVLRDVSFTVEPGRLLGLLGRTGSGKTTIARLLVRFYDPRSGAIRLGGVDARSVALRDVRSHVALVTQDVRLFHASARDNITLFDSSIDDRRVAAVVEELGLDGWLATLPAGLDSLVTAETGLSAGEAQLLAFARVLLRDPGLVVLDEATARLDPATERHVEEAVSRLFRERTAIVIAHRLQTVLRADDILVLEGGRVLEHGSRASLVADESSRFCALLRTGMEEVLR